MITKLTDWRIFEKKHRKHKNDGIDIVIVDVQKAFHEYFGDTYVEELEKYCEDYKRVFQIWDETSSKKPDYAFPNQVGTYVKKYGGELMMEDVEQYFPEPMWQTVKASLDNIPNYGDMFETMYGDTWIYIDGKHKWFKCSRELMNLFKSFKNQERTVVLVGGAEAECIKDVYVAMLTLGVKVAYEPKFVYSFHGSKFQ